MEIDISVGSSIVAVSYEDSKYYFESEIQSEGKLRTDVPLIVVLPEQERGDCSPQFIDFIFNSMTEIRKSTGPNFHEFDNYYVDMGFLDIQVFFKGERKVIAEMFKSSSQSFFDQNLIHVDNLMKGSFNNQMIMIIAPHVYDVEGKFCLHYHNIIFGLKMENNLVGHFNMDELFDIFYQQNRSINLVDSNILQF